MSFLARNISPFLGQRSTMDVYDYDYYDYNDNHPSASQQQRQIQLDTFTDLNIAERVSGALATLSIIGLSYLSSRSRTADLQLQINIIFGITNSQIFQG